MELLERYLNAVRRNLPAKDADDIVAELREELLARAEEREERLDRTLDEEEWEKLLVEFGHPLVIAARFRQRQWLIGPELYPFYLYFLKLIGGIVAFGITVAMIVKAAIHQGAPGPLIVDYLGSLWWSVAVTIGSITIVFALIERYGGVDRHFRTWHPRQLPEIELAGKEPGRWESGIEVVLGLVMLLWWAGAVHFPIPMQSDKFRLAAAPIWTQLYWPIVALVAARLAHNLIQWLRPNWRWLRGLFAITTTVGAVILAVLLYRAGHWMTVVPVSMSAEQARDLQTSVDLSLRIAVVAAAAVWVWQYLQQMWRWARSPRRGAAR